ncbi:capsule biosynthesis protein [Gilliamella mensalis]|uniref:capsule biosynthesis protein n=1 Tax=Gilliamella mensalis TaxID=1908520 RepID=UPI000A149D93|nr:capsular biosynthesis protein [Gilliamella mensalis]
MSHYLYELAHTKSNILLLQGPIGPFFKNVAAWLQNSGCNVYKINLNGGDEYFYPHDSVSFYESIDAFPQFLKDYIRQHTIDAIVVFGDCRIYHKIAKSIVESNSNLSFWVFEEGYFRPHYITFEKNGVNGFSLIPKNHDFYQSIEITSIDESKNKCHYYSMAYFGIIYYIFIFFKKYKYSNYVHHRKTSLSFYASRWTLALIRKFKAKLTHPKLIKNIINNDYKPFYIFPLQCNEDFQIQVHSHYHSMKSYIFRVIRSFSLFADKKNYLLIKHHPMDDGFHNYARLIKKLANRYGVSQRVIYIHGIPMPILLRKAIGLVTVNSTCGLSALIHGLPVIALSNAHYDIKGLTFQEGLNRFWKEGKKPDTQLFERYRSYLYNKSQIKGSIYYKDFKLNAN